MRLLNTLTLELELFIEPPPYAILSHRWTEDEVLFEDVGKPLSEWQGKAGASKVLQGSVTALSLGHRYLWIDSCCIDKKSSAELTEAINSMYMWYRDAEICLAFLSDVQSSNALLNSIWFTRGWTLQELVAPCSLRFYSATWTDLGSRESWARKISQTTSISIELLLQQQRQKGARPDSTRQLLDSYSTHKKMGWAAKRVTTRPEDLAYSMIGIFGVSMPLIYGEGRAKAFRRLQEEIMKTSYDQSILAHISTAPSPSLTMGPEAFSFGLEIVKSSHSQTHSIEISGSALNLDLILCPLTRPGRSYELAIGCLECFVRIGGTTLTRPGLLMTRYLDGWCRYKWDAIYLVHPGSGNVARAFPPHFG
ncbi:hypothetical protein PG993_010483 [Apiospora rasikravindrae]|uniref:Heterokaryon incompatibility domain-containing protein n=1 Tax=Apiospora rasikravindrae TaxID=990691 RepID=A0ABR1SMD3_9PEZI